MPIKRKIILGAKIALTALLLGWLLHRADIPSIGRSMLAAAPGWVLAALLLHVVGFFISAWRWKLLLGVQGADVTAWFLVRSYLVGIFFNNFLPSTVGGDVVRARDTAPFAGSGARALTVVLVERASGIFALGLFALGAPLFGLMAAAGKESAVAWWTLGFLFGGFAAFVALLRPAVLSRLRGLLDRGRAAAGPEPGIVGAVLEKMERFVETLEVFARNPAVLRTTFLLALLLQANVILHYWCIGRSLSLAVPPAAFFLVIPAATVILLLPVSINGIGAREAVFVLFLGSYGVGVPEAIAFSWIAYGLVLVQGVVGGIVYALRSSR